MSARPGRITEVIDIDLPRPRGFATREDPRYFEKVTAVREALRRGGAVEATAEAEVDVASADRTTAEGGIG
jgi:ABC-type nitrate/sulfonate/bicarbonate transport system ATPase subunit